MARRGGTYGSRMQLAALSKPRLRARMCVCVCCSLKFRRALNSSRWSADFSAERGFSGGSLRLRVMKRVKVS